MTKEQVYKEFELTLEAARDENSDMKLQAFYMLGRIRVYSELKIIDVKDYKILYEKLEKISGYTTEEFDKVAY